MKQVKLSSLPVAKALDGMENSLQECIFLSNQEVPMEIAIEIAKALETNTKCKFLFLSCCGVNDQVAKVLGQSLKKNRNLEILELFQNNIEDAGATALGEAMEVNKTLLFLGLGHNHIGSIGAKALSEGLKNNTTLKELLLHKNNLEHEGVEALSQRFMKNCHLEKLQLSSNKIDDSDATILFPSLTSKNQKLMVLNVGNNLIGERSVNFIGEMLKTNTSLKELLLNSNRIKNIEPLTEALYINTTLTTLNVADNLLGDVDALMLSKALKINTSLIVILLNNNKIGTIGAEALSESLEANSTLESFSIVANPIGESGRKRLMKSYLLSPALLRECHVLNINNFDLHSLNCVLESALKINCERVFHRLFEARNASVAPWLIKVNSYRKVQLLLRMPTRRRLPKELFVLTLNYLLNNNIDIPMQIEDDELNFLMHP